MQIIFFLIICHRTIATQADKIHHFPFRFYWGSSSNSVTQILFMKRRERKKNIPRPYILHQKSKQKQQITQPWYGYMFETSFIYLSKQRLEKTHKEFQFRFYSVYVICVKHMNVMLNICILSYSLICAILLKMDWSPNFTVLYFNPLLYAGHFRNQIEIRL